MKNLKLNLTRMGLILLTIILIIGTFTTCVKADTDLFSNYSASDTGNIGSSSIFQGFYKLLANLAATLQWIIPIAGVAWILWYVFRIMTGDEQDQQRYKKGLVKVIICIVVAEIACVLINLIVNYFID